MLRQLTKQVGRWKAGEKHDWPRDVWNKIAADAGMKLDDFSTVVSDNPVLQSPLKGRVKLHSRLGATQ